MAVALGPAWQTFRASLGHQAKTRRRGQYSVGPPVRQLPGALYLRQAHNRQAAQEALPRMQDRAAEYGPVSSLPPVKDSAGSGSSLE